MPRGSSKPRGRQLESQRSTTTERQLSNDPKILTELSPEELSWLADRLHEEWSRSVAAGAIVSSSEKESQEKIKKVEAHKQMTIRLLNRFLNNAANQGFGDL